MRADGEAPRSVRLKRFSKLFQELFRSENNTLPLKKLFWHYLSSNQVIEKILPLLTVFASVFVIVT